MSRLAGGPVTVASKTTFDALAVDTGEDSEEEEVPEVGPVPETYVSSPFFKSGPRSQLTPISSFSQPDAKPTKSAIKKAQKLARVEKRQRLKALAKSQAGSSASPENSVASSEVTPLREAVPLPEPSKPLGLSDSYILSTVSPPVEESSAEREKAPIGVNGLALKINAPSASPMPTALETPTAHESVPTAPPAPQPAEKPPQPMTLPLHDETAAKDAEKVKKRQSFLTRTLWTCIMITGFVGM
jgi:phosphatidate cytidylyltransferase